MKKKKTKKTVEPPFKYMQVYIFTRIINAGKKNVAKCPNFGYKNIFLGMY